MNNEVRMPIKTVREGNKITKTCVEDIYKIANRVLDAMDRAYNKSKEMIDDTENIEYGKNSAVLFGKGTSQPCLKDAFDEEIGNNIAFMKMKLNVNVKKHNLLVKIYNEYIKLLACLDNEIDGIDVNIRRDLEGVRKHNPDYLETLEYELGI